MLNKFSKNSTEEERCKKTKVNAFKKGIDTFKGFLKNQKKRIFAFALALLTFGSTLTPAVSTYALDSISFDHSTYLNAHYSTGNWTTADGHTHNNTGQVAFMTKSDGTPVYCIQVYEETTGSTGTTQDSVFVCEDGATYNLTNNDEFFINNAETGELKIIKTSSDGIVEGFEFLIEGISEAGTEISITAKTDKDGIIDRKSVV